MLYRDAKDFKISWMYNINFFLAADAESLQVIRGSAGLPETERTPFYDGRDGGRDIDTVLRHLFPIH